MYTAAVKANNEAYDLVKSGELEYLSEGFFDAIKRAWNKFKSFLVELFQKVKNWIGKSVSNMIEYFEIEPVIKLNNNISW